MNTCAYLWCFFRCFALIFCIISGSLAGASEKRSLGVQNLRFTSERGYLQIEVEDDSLIHFEVGRNRNPLLPESTIYTSPMIAKHDFKGPSFFFHSGNLIKTQDLHLIVSTPDLCVSVYDSARKVDLGRICADSLDQATKQLTIYPHGLSHVYGLGNYFYDSNTADGDWSGRDWNAVEFGNHRHFFLGGAPSISQFPILYGIGDRSQNMAIFLDSPYRLSWNFRDSRKWELKTWGDQLRFFVIGGENLPALRKKYMELVGKPLVPPKSTFGLWVSKFGYRSWDELKSELKLLREKKFPIDGFALDIQWFGGTFADPLNARMGTLSFDHNHFSHPQTVVSDLKEREKTRLMLIEESYVDERIPEYQLLKGSVPDRCFLARLSETLCSPVRFGDEANPMWWGRGGMMDWTHPRSGQLWHQVKRMEFAKMGITSHWTDLGEPEMYHPDAYYYGIEPGKNRQADIHNLYNFKWLQSIHDGYQEPTMVEQLKTSLHLAYPPRYFSMSRSGAPGIQRFGAGMWSGDIGRNMGSLRAHLNTQMHMSLAGVDYYNSDVGGFIETVDGKEPSHNDQELYTQWFANSALGEIPLRPHGWAYGNEGTSFSPAFRGDLESNRANLGLRYELFPYLYSLAHLAHLQGDPIFPPLVYYYQDDLAVRKIGNEKMIGQFMLYGIVAGFRQIERKMYLPAGKWVNYYSREWVHSKGEDIGPVPIYWKQEAHYVFKLPLFLREGAIIPKLLLTRNLMGSGSFKSLSDEGAMARAREHLFLQIAGSEKETSFTVFEDDGETQGYLKGEFQSTGVSQKILVGPRSEIQRIRIESAKGDFNGARKKRRYWIDLLVDQRTAETVELNGNPVRQCASERELKISDICWVNSGGNRVLIKTAEMPVHEVKELKVSLHKVSH